MDEQEVPDNSSEEISKDKLRDSDDFAQASGPAEGQEEENIGHGDSSPGSGFAPPPEEMPTMQWSDVYAELAEYENRGNESDESNQDTAASASEPQQSGQTGPLEGLEDAMSWLEQLAVGQGMPIDEMPTLVTEQTVAEIQPSDEDAGAEKLSNDDDVALTLELDSDPMAWLEQLAVDQSSPLEELPSVADRLLASEIISQTDIPPNSTINDPYDVNQALTYLEQLAGVQGVDLSHISFDSEQPVDSLASALAIIDGLALAGLAANSGTSENEKEIAEKDMTPVAIEDNEPLEQSKPEQFSDLSTDMPDDPQEALDWLSNLGEETEDSSMEVTQEADTVGPRLETHDPGLAKIDSDPAAPEHPEEDLQIDADALEEMPEDPDEAVAWMEDLAIRGPQKATAETGEPVSRNEPASSSASGSSSARSESLLAAQAALDSDDLDQAISIYQTVLDEGNAPDELVGALENAVEVQENSPGLLRLLGDAYMQNGEVDKAISTYRKGFDHL